VSTSFATQQQGAMLILDLEDQFARDRGLGGLHPRLLGAIRFFLVARTDAATRVSTQFPAPLEMKVIPNSSGFYLFFGNVVAPDGSTRRLDPDGWPWTIRVVSDFYQTLDETPAAVPASFAAGMPGSGASSHIAFVLSPGAAYPFPNEPPGHPGGRLRGALRNPDGSAIEGVRVEALDAANRPQLNPAVTAADGQWVLALPALPSSGLVTVRFTFADGTAQDVTGVKVLPERENNLAQTALRGQVRLRAAGVRDAAISVDAVSGAQTLTDGAGNWFFFFDFRQAGGTVNVTATLPDRSASRSSSVVVQPRATVVVPSFNFT
jgi:hypothetical protein